MKMAASNVYDHPEVAERYNRKGGFAPLRKEKMQEVVLDQLIALTSPQSALLELGAGTGLFTEKIIAANYFSQIHVTDGAPAMLEIAQQKLTTQDSSLRFSIIDFANQWSERFAQEKFDAVTSAMSLHHAPDKRRLFQQIFAVLKPQGLFVFGDHMAGSSSLAQYLIGRERAFVVLGRDAQLEQEQIRAQIQIDEQRQEGEGNLCESVAQYQVHLAACGFEDIDCLWRDYWLAVFIARKPGVERPE